MGSRKVAALAAAAAALAAGAAFYALPARYVSTTTLAYSDAAQLLRLRYEVFSAGSLGATILKPSLNLYPAERQRRPLDDLIRDMRDRDIHLMEDPARSELRISFAYSDPHKAQATLRDIVARFVDGNATLRMVDPPSLPAQRESRAPAPAVGIGLVAGMLCWAIAIGRRSRTFRIAFAAGSAGAVLGTAAAMLLPGRYVSTAALLVHQPQAEAIARLRSQNVQVALDSGRLTLARTDHDPERAAAVVQQAVSTLVESSHDFEILDVTSRPELPSARQPWPFAGAGFLGGILLGLAIARFRPPPATPHLSTRPYLPAN